MGKKKKEKGTHSKGKKRNVHIYKAKMYMVKVGMGDVMAREAGQQETTEKWGEWSAEILPVFCRFCLIRIF